MLIVHLNVQSVAMPPLKKHLTPLLAIVAQCLLVSSLHVAPSRAACSLASSGVAAAVNPVRGPKPGDGSDPDRFVEIYWWGINSPLEGDIFGIWSHDPSEDPLGAIESVSVTDNMGQEGHFVFSVPFDSSLIPDDVTDPATEMCLPYWVGLISQDAVLYSSCLKIEPFWMKNMQDLLQDVPLTEVALPGSHDAGATYHYGNWTADGGLISDTVAKWAFTHEDGIWEQLVMGVRYLDIRIGYYPEREHLYYLNHADVIVAPLYVILEDVQRFMSETEEIVIFDIHSLEHNFNSYPEAAPGLISLLELYFEPHMLSNSYAPNPPLGLVWSSGKRLIVTYPNPPPSDLYWANVHHLWGNVNDVDDLIAYFDAEIPGQVGRGLLWSSMTEITPSAMDVTLNRWGGLDGAADITNLPVTLKLRSDWWSQVNIVAMDFGVGSDVVSTIIEANYVKFTCPPRKKLS